MSIELKIFIEPRPKGRPRFTRRGTTYTPKHTADFEREVKRQARFQYKGKPLEGALSIDIDFFCRRPKRLVKDYPHPDCDNMVKAVLDALNEITWGDDSQVCEIVARKQYAQINTTPHISVQIRAFHFGDAQIE